MKSNTKKGLKFALILTLFITFLFSVLDKIGYKKYYTYTSPLSWSEFVCRIPFYLGSSILIFLCITIWWVFFRREPKYCIKCKKLVPRNVKDDSICPTCQKPSESLDGVFERHPELKDDES
jgi:hypothetical protein